MSRPLLLWVVPSRDHVRVNEGNDEIWLAIRSGHFALQLSSIFSAPIPTLFLLSPSQLPMLTYPLVCLQILLNRYFLLRSPGACSLCTNYLSPLNYEPRHHFEWFLSVRDGHLPVGTCLALYLSFLQKDSTLAILECFFTRAATIPSSYISGSLVQFSRSVHSL